MITKRFIVKEDFTLNVESTESKFYFYMSFYRGEVFTLDFESSNAALLFFDEFSLHETKRYFSLKTKKADQILDSLIREEKIVVF